MLRTLVPAGVVSVVLALLLCSAAAAQPNVWKGNGPFGGAAAVVVVHPADPQTIYAGTHFGGIFRSTDGGATWASLATSPYVVNAMAIDPGNPTTMYAGDPAGGFYKSIDGGVTWTEMSGSPTRQQQLLALVVDPVNTNVVYAATGLAGIFRSADGGATWAPINNGLTDLEVRALAIARSNPLWMFAATPTGVFKTSDGGTTWARVTPPNWSTAALAVDDRVPGAIAVYAGGAGGVFRSLDGGDNWSGPTALSGAPSNFVTAVALDPLDPTVVYAGLQNAGGVWKSPDKGATWADFSEGMTARNVQSLVIAHRAGEGGFSLHAGTLYIGGVFTRTNAGGSWSPWTETDRGMAPGINTVTPDPANPGTVYVGTPAGVFRGDRNPDGSLSWTHRDAGITGGGVIALALAPSAFGTTPTLFAAVGRADGGVWKSSDGGGTWVRVYPISPPENRWMETIAVAPSNADVVYAGTKYPGGTGSGGGVFSSVDGGATWNGPLGSATLSNANVTALAVDPLTPSIVYAGTEGGIFISTDGGSTWVASNTGPTSLGILALAIDPTNGQAIYAGTAGGAFKTTDGGQTWVRMASLPCSRVPSIAVAPSNTQVVYSACGVYQSLDGGATWHHLPDGPSQGGATLVTADAQDPSTVYAATAAAGVFVMTYQNNTPQFVSPTPADGASLNVAAGSSLMFTVTAQDPDSVDQVSLSWTGLPQGASFGGFTHPSNPIQGTFNWNPAFSQVGQYTITFTAADPLGATASTSVTINVSAPANSPPQFVYPPTPPTGQVFNVPIGFTFQLTIRAQDPDAGASVTLGAEALPTGATFAPVGPANPVQATFKWTPVCGQAGQYTVTFTAVDNLGFAGTPTTIVINVGANLNAQDNQVRVFRTSSDVDAVGESDPLAGTMGWNLVVFNSSVCAVSSPTITATSGLASALFSPPVVFPLIRTAPTLAGNSGFQVTDVGPGRSSVPALFTPGFQSSRSMSPLVIPAGGTTQTVTVQVTPIDPAFNTPDAQITVIVSDISISSTAMGPNNQSDGETLMSPACPSGSASCQWSLKGVKLNKTYVFSATLQVPNTTGAPSSYKPALTVSVTPNERPFGQAQFAQGRTISDPTLDGGTPGSGSIAYSVAETGAVWFTSLTHSYQVSYASLAVNRPPTFVTPPTPANGSEVIVEAGSAMAPITIQAQDLDSNGTVTLGVTGMPAGAAFPIPPPGRTVTTIVTWPSARPVGQYPVIFTATDNRGGVASLSVTIKVVDTTPPVLTLPGPIVAEATGASGAVVSYQVTAVDTADPAPIVSCVRPSGSTFPLGTSSVTCSATDAAGNQATGSFTVSVVDTTPPTATAVTATPNVLWPPNHEMASITLVASASDLVTGTPACRVVSVESSQPVNGTGDGDTAPDWVFSGLGLDLTLRAERAGGAGDRTYTAWIRCRDAAGNDSSQRSVSVRVPANQGM